MPVVISMPFHVIMYLCNTKERDKTFSPEVSTKKYTMTHIIAEPCIGTKDTACVEVCPSRLYSPFERQRQIR